jgi:hypothetical protein
MSNVFRFSLLVIIPLALGFSSIMNGQTISFGNRVVVSNNASGAISTHAADIDGDGDLDVLSASRYDNKIAWYANVDGEGTFGGQQIVSYSSSRPMRVHSADFDNDGDVDILASSWNDNDFVWLENTAGDGSSWTEHMINGYAAGIIGIYAADFNGDGWIDVVSANRSASSIVWHPNLGGGNMGPGIILNSSAGGAGGVYGADIDNDGDIDILSASMYDNEIAWYINLDGTGTFSGEQIISSLADGANCVKAADINGDGTLDVVSTSRDDDKIAWYSNIDGVGNFGPEQIVSTSTDHAIYVEAADFDLDGDLDLVSASHWDDEISIFENIDGAGTFGAQQILSNSAMEATSVFVADVDADGLPDVLCSSMADAKISLFRNLTIVEVAEASEKPFDFSMNCYPNPFNPQTTIVFDLQETQYLNISVYNQNGQKVTQLPGGLYERGTNTVPFNAAAFPSGIYYCQIETGQNIRSIKMILSR